MTNQLLFVAGVCNAYLLIKCRMCVKITQTTQHVVQF